LFQTPCDQGLVARGFVWWDALPGLPGAQIKEIFEMHISKRLLLGLGLAALIMESLVVQPAFAADKVSLFKIITAKDEIVIGIS